MHEIQSRSLEIGDESQIRILFASFWASAPYPYWRLKLRECHSHYFEHLTPIDSDVQNPTQISSHDFEHAICISIGDQNSVKPVRIILSIRFLRIEYGKKRNRAMHEIQSRSLGIGDESQSRILFASFWASASFPYWRLKPFWLLSESYLPNCGSKTFQRHLVKTSKKGKKFQMDPVQYPSAFMCI